MIIAQPIGGLANQMSVYAAARALSVHHGVPLKLDLSAVSEDTKRIYELDKLKINAQAASKEEITDLIGSDGGFGYRVRKKLRRYGFRFGLHKEKMLKYDERFFALPAEIYLSGNYHSVRYYASIRALLQEEFSIALPLSKASLCWEKKIKGCQSVAMHIRRGDYANDQKTRDYHGLLDLDYYRRAVDVLEKELRERQETAEFFIFSDDPEWVQKNLKVSSVTHYVDCNDASTGYQDFHLMRQCKHNIIANSGFSRWPAWLNSNPDNVVCMPKQWFQKVTLPDEDNGPISWLRVQNSFS